MVLSSTLTDSSVVYESRHVIHMRTYSWPMWRMRVWSFVMLLASSSILGVFGSFMQTQDQMRLPVPWYLPYYVTVATITLTYVLAVAWLLYHRRLLPGVVLIGASALFVFWMVGFVASSAELWRSGGVQSQCNAQVFNQSPHGTDAETLAWLQQRNICQTWYLVFAMGLTRVIFLIWSLLISLQVFLLSSR